MSKLNINFNNKNYTVIKSALSEVRTDFISHLGTIAGEGLKLTVDGVEYSVDPTKLNDAMDNLAAVLNRLASGDNGYGDNDDSESCPIHFGERYVYDNGYAKVVYIFYEDGSGFTQVDFGGGDLETQEFPADTFTYTQYEILMGEVLIATISADGTQISTPDGGVLTLETSSNNCPLHFGEKYYITNGTDTISFYFYEDGSLKVYLGETFLPDMSMPAGTLEYKKTEIWMGGAPYASISPDGAIITNLEDPTEVIKLESASDDSALPITWTYRDIQNNPVVNAGPYGTFIKVSDTILTETELLDAEITVQIPDRQDYVGGCVEIQAMSEGIIAATYKDGSLTVILVNVTTTENSLGIVIPETGLYVIYFGDPDEQDIKFTLAPIPSNSCPIHFGEKYSATIGDGKGTYIFYEDGSADAYGVDGSNISIPAGYITYRRYAIWAEGVLFGTVSEDGTQIVLDDITLTLETNSGDDSAPETHTVVFNSGDVEGLPTVFIEEIPFVKISDLTPTIEELDGSTFTVNSPSQDIAVTDVLSVADGTLFKHATNDQVIVTEMMLVALEDTTLGSTNVSAGIWIINYSAVGITDLQATITWGGNTSSSSYALAPGLYGSGAISLCEEGDVESAQAMMTTSWDELITNGVVHVEDGVVYTATGMSDTNPSASTLVGDLVMPNNTITALGTFNVLQNSGSSAFLGCSNLTGIVIPDSVTSICDLAFGVCSNLTTIIFGENSRLTNISYNAFNSTGLTHIEIPASVVNINEGAFYKCTSLKNVIFVEGSQLTKIDHSAFDGCTSLDSIDIPASVELIGVKAFTDCTSLTSATFGENSQLTNIEYSAFSNCTNLTSIEIPARVTTIGLSVFNHCNRLASITVDSNNTVYHSSGNCLIHTASKTLLVGCQNSVIPMDGSVTTIGSDAFPHCTGLKSITIPKSVTAISSQAFNKCTSLESITFEGNIAQWNSITFGDSWNYEVPATYVQCSDGQVTL